MSSIRLTRQLRNKLLWNGKAMFDPQLAKANESLPLGFVFDVVDEVYNRVFLPYAEALREDWYMEVNMAYLNFTVEGRPLTLMKQLTKTYRIPALEQYRYTDTCITLKEADMSAEHVGIYHDHILNIRKIEKEKTEFAKKLWKVLSNCNTVKQFLKVWPQGNHLFTKELRDELRERQAIKRKPKEAVELDEETLSTLNVGLLKQSMLNS